MTLWVATSIGIGGMVGADIFLILGIATAIAGMVALLNTYSYAKLGIKYFSCGGPRCLSSNLSLI
ncbi:hypothetical protein [Desulfobacula sp.]